MFTLIADPPAFQPASCWPRRSRCSRPWPPRRSSGRAENPQGDRAPRPLREWRDEVVNEKAQKGSGEIVRTVSCDSRIISGFSEVRRRIVTIAVSIAMSLPCPMATLKSACASRAVVDPVAGHGHRPAFGLQLPDESGLFVRQDARPETVIPAFRAVSRAEPALSPVSIRP